MGRGGRQKKKKKEHDKPTQTKKHLCIFFFLHQEARINKQP